MLDSRSVIKFFVADVLIAPMPYPKLRIFPGFSSPSGSA